MNFAPHLVQDDASLSGTHAALALADATSSLRVGIPGWISLGTGCCLRSRKGLLLLPTQTALVAAALPYGAPSGASSRYRSKCGMQD